MAEAADTPPVAPVSATTAAAPTAGLPAGAAVEAAEPVTDSGDEKSKWKKTLIIVGNHSRPRDDKRALIVVEARTFDRDDDGQVTGVTLKTEGYHTGADLYFRTDDAVTFPKDGKVVTLGVDVTQGAFWGFSDSPGVVNYGPAYPAYAAANLAYLNGAKDIEIVGLSKEEKATLQPWIDALPAGGPDPVDDAPDIRAPADVNITLS